MRRSVLLLVGLSALGFLGTHTPAAVFAHRVPMGGHAIIRVLVPSTEACVDDRFSATFELVVNERARYFPAPLWFACSERRIVRADSLLVIDTVPLPGAERTRLAVPAPRAATRADLTSFPVLELLGHPRESIERDHGSAWPAAGSPWMRHRRGLEAQYDGERCAAVRVPVSSDVHAGRLDAWLGLDAETRETVTVVRSGPYAEVRLR